MVDRQEYEKVIMQNCKLVEQSQDLIKERDKYKNIVEDLEKWLENIQINDSEIDEWTIIQVRDKILELKEGNKDEN